MSRYEIRNDGTGARWDWLNLITCDFPYTVYEWREDTHVKWWPVGSESTMRAARRRIRRARAWRAAGEVVYRESDGRPELPDLREWALAHDLPAAL